MITNTQIVEEARTYLGTPFHHCGRVKGLGVDCVGLVAGVAQKFDITHHDLKTYSKTPDGVTLIQEFSKCLHHIKLHKSRHGDVLVFWYRDVTKPCHAGIITPKGLIHTYAVVGKVVEHRIDDFWKKRIVCAFRYPNVDFVNDEKPSWQL